MARHSGQDRAALAVDEALRSPLMDGGSLLPRVAHVLVNITGGGDLTLAEIQGLMQALHHRIADNAQVLFGATVDANYNGPPRRDRDRLAAGRFHSRARSRPRRWLRRPRRPSCPGRRRHLVLRRRRRSACPSASRHPRRRGRVRKRPGRCPPAPRPHHLSRRRPRRRRSPFIAVDSNAASRPIVDGEDLDVPAFLRKGLKK